MSTSVITDDGQGNVTIARSSDLDGGLPPCTLHSTLSADGKTLTGKVPETCPANASIVQTITSASANMAAGNMSYSSSAAYTLSGTNANGKMVQATGSSAATCTKM
jgi:hypothetical protein